MVGRLTGRPSSRKGADAAPRPVLISVVFNTRAGPRPSVAVHRDDAGQLSIEPDPSQKSGGAAASTFGHAFDDSTAHASSRADARASARSCRSIHWDNPRNSRIASSGKKRCVKSNETRFATTGERRSRLRTLASSCSRGPLTNEPFACVISGSPNSASCSTIALNMVAPTDPPEMPLIANTCSENRVSAMPSAAISSSRWARTKAAF